jgi:putative FmdB family regulatory protein
MPIYDYRCSACGHLTEVVHGINDHGPRFCPECGAEGTMSKGFTLPAIHFKGSGWAKKDRSATRASTSASSGDSADSSSPSSTEGKTADKPATDSTDTPAKPAKSDSTPAPSGGSAD